MEWKKFGIVYVPDGSQSWAKTHAMLPTPVLRPDGVIRIYYTACDANMVGRPGYVDLDPENFKVVCASKAHLLDVGMPGTFDDNGVALCSMVYKDGLYYMYYAGFEMCHHIRYRILTGLAVSEDGGNTFRRVQETPVLERAQTERYFRCGPYALWDQYRKKMRLWYIAGSDWTDLNGKMMPVYSLKYAESGDGIHWPQQGVSSLKLTDPDEHGFGRPWVLKRGEHDYQLFFSVRKRSLAAYRLAYAESPDGINWVRNDQVMGLDVTSDSFDSNAIMYSAVITLNKKTYCFYNGNNFGQDGFAVAELIS